jgi:O-antigen/teichoic acid export membrane protein
MCLAVLTANALFGMKRQDLELRTNIVSTIISIALAYPLVRVFGPMGGTLTLTARYLIAFILRIPAMRRHCPGLWPWGQLARLAAALALMTIPLAAVPFLGTGVRSLALVPVAAAFYLAGLGVTKVVPVLPLLHQLCPRRRKPAPTLAWVTEVRSSNE